MANGVGLEIRADGDRYRMQVWICPVRDFVLDQALEQVPADKRASLLRSFAQLGAYQWMMYRRQEAGMEVVPTAKEAKPTLMSLAGAVD